MKEVYEWLENKQKEIEYEIAFNKDKINDWHEVIEDLKKQVQEYEKDIYTAQIENEQLKKFVDDLFDFQKSELFSEINHEIMLGKLKEI